MKINVLSIICLLILSVGANAQPYNVDDVQFQLSSGGFDLEELKSTIDEAAAHPKTQNSPKMYYFKGMVYLKLATDNDTIAVKYPNALNVALESFQKCIENDSKEKYSDDAKNNGLVFVAMGLYNKGYSAYDQGDYANAINYLNKAIPLMKYDTKDLLKQNNLTENVLIQLIAYSAVGAEDNKLARSSFQRLIDNGFRDPSVYASLAQLKLLAEDTTGALETIAEGKEYFEQEKSLINLELDIYLKQGRSEELIAKLDKAIEEDGGNAIYYFARAISYEGLAQIIGDQVSSLLEVRTGTKEEEAIKTAGKPKSITTTDGVRTLTYDYGTIIVGKAGTVDKVKISDKANVEVENYLDKALADYESIIEIDPGYFDAYYNIGAMYQNKVSAIVDEINAKGIYQADKLAAYNEKMIELYKKALENFEIVFENNTEMSAQEKLDLAVNMKRIYAQTKEMDKFNEMKAWIEEHQ